MYAYTDGIKDAGRCGVRMISLCKLMKGAKDGRSEGGSFFTALGPFFHVVKEFLQGWEVVPAISWEACWSIAIAGINATIGNAERSSSLKVIGDSLCLDIVQLLDVVATCTQVSTQVALTKMYSCNSLHLGAK